jgi:hypothetical protein
MRTILKSLCGRDFEIAPKSREQFNKEYIDATEIEREKLSPNAPAFHAMTVAPRSAYDHYKSSNNYHEWKDFSVEWLSVCQIVIIGSEEEFLN